VKANPGVPRKKIEILDVKYPKNRTRFGVIKLHQGKLIFRCHDSKFVDMIVRDIERRPFE